MTNKEVLQPSNAAEAVDTPVQPPVQPVEPSPEEIVLMVRAIRERLAVPSPETTAAVRARRAARVDNRLIDEAIGALGVVNGVETALGQNHAELREEVAVLSRWAAAAPEVRALLSAIDAAILVRRDRVGLTALKIFRICEQLSRDGKNERLAAYVASMRRSNRFARARRRRPQAEPEVPAQPPVDARQ